MQTISMETVIRSVRDGAAPDEGVIAWVTQTGMQDFLNDVRAMYPIVFQERRVGRTWEISLARACQIRLGFRLSPRSVFPAARLTPVFRDCLFVVAEGGALTGLSVASRLACRPTRGGYTLSSGQGHQLFRDFGEWKIKPVAKKKTVLTEAILRKYGWRFDLSWLHPTSPAVNRTP